MIQIDKATAAYKNESLIPYFFEYFFYATPGIHNSLTGRMDFQIAHYPLHIQNFVIWNSHDVVVVCNGEEILFCFFSFGQRRVQSLY